MTRSWARSWSKIQGANTWTTLFEKEDNEKILMKQRYGREEEWREHFDYLLPFLKDSRYIKIEGKPVLILYKTDDVYCLSQMLRCWNKEAIKAGLAGIYMIGESCSKSNVVDAVMNHQPATVWAQMLSQVQKKNGISVLDYEQMWINIIDSACKVDKDTFFMGFTGFDNTPRHGKNGLVVEGASPSIFEKYFGIFGAVCAENAAESSIYRHKADIYLRRTGSCGPAAGQLSGKGIAGSFTSACFYG